jgi:hypothetical protein
MANAKNSDFITRVRQAVAELLAAIAKLDALRLEWDSLYNVTVTEKEFDGTNAEITIAELSAVFNTQAAIKAEMDKGHRTNLLKAK